MVDCRMFPILGDPCLKAVPWAFLAPHEAQAISNHSQGLETLARRGGLGPDEVWAVVTGRRWGSIPRGLSAAHWGFVVMQLVYNAEVAAGVSRDG